MMSYDFSDLLQEDILEGLEPRIFGSLFIYYSLPKPHFQDSSSFHSTIVTLLIIVQSLREK